ncbi:MAG: nucleotidyltransferase domain-containing protein [Candidatus Heimdallarchaeota archaeon]|nr:nucleotidyltransferase domain-containing protein [Candidatus Heimdallarchaeota archaeon]MDH5647582.1 nucleotidyltransferase domain-containing protein [Candidatus Heimdallarchaeota archaeon]
MDIEEAKIQILNEIKKIEHQYQITVIFAVESGSRLWGIESRDSDFDIRFVYKRRIIDYLSLQKMKDSINIMMDPFDYAGWDLVKFMNLANKSNPSALEWLKADITYIGEENREQFRLFLNNVNIKNIYHHYRSIAHSNYTKYLKDKKKKTIKKYLYVMRGIINALYVLKFNQLPPQKLYTAISKVDINNNVKTMLYEIINTKITGTLEEESITSDTEILDSFILEFMMKQEDHLNYIQTNYSIKPQLPTKQLNPIFFKEIGFNHQFIHKSK